MSSSTKIHTNPSRCKTLVVRDMTFRSVYDYSVTQQDMEKARRELNEMDSERDGCIQKLRKRLENDPKIWLQVDDHYLLCFLRFRKFDIDRAFDIIRKAHSGRIQRPEIFALPGKLEQMYNINVFNWLPYRDEEGCPILYHRFGMWNPKHLSFNELMQLGCSMMDLFSMNPACQISKVVAIWDYRGFNVPVWHLSPLMNPRFLWFFCCLWRECYPERIKLVLFVNLNRILKTLFNTGIKLAVTQGVSRKVLDRFKVVDVEEVKQYVNPVLLPKSLGGAIEDSECSITGHVMDNLPYLRHMRSIGTTSDRAPEKNVGRTNR